MAVSSGLGRACALVVGLGACAPAFAFKPNEAGHLGITRESLSAIQRTVGAETLSFSDRAIDEINEANRNTDLVTFLGIAEHFDDEAFHDSSMRLVSLRENVIAKLLLAPPDGEAARRNLGGALHTTQDFYAHSNWVELGETAIDPRLGRAVFESLPLGVSTCPNSAGTLGGDGLTSETTGYFPFPNPCAGPPDGTPGGKCRHGLEFFCPNGLNKDAPDRPNYAAARALAVAATTDYVGQILDDPRLATNAAALAALVSAAPPAGSILAIDAGLDRAATKRSAVPVDSTVRRVACRSSGAAVRVLRPNGAPVQPGEAGVTITTTASGRVVAVEAPEAGSWTAVFPRGDGRFFLNVAADSDLQLDRFAFVTLGGRMGHQGFLPIATPPVRKSSTLAMAHIVGPIASVRFALVTLDGKKILDAPLFANDPEGGATDRVGLVGVPVQSFRVIAVGQDTLGNPFRRTVVQPFVPSK